MPEPPATLSAVKRYMLETRGRARSAFARLAALDRKQDLDELGSLIDNLVGSTFDDPKAIGELRGEVLVFLRR